MNLSLRDALRFHQVAQQVSVRGSRDRMILILVYRDEITESIKIRLFAAVEYLLIRQTVEHCLGCIQMLIGRDRDERQFLNEAQVRVLLSLIEEFHGLTCTKCSFATAV